MSDEETPDALVVASVYCGASVSVKDGKLALMHSPKMECHVAILGVKEMTEEEKYLLSRRVLRMLGVQITERAATEDVVQIIATQKGAMA